MFVRDRRGPGAAGWLGGRFEVAAGDRAVSVVSAAHQEPLVLSGLADVEARLAATAVFWQGWAEGLRYGWAWRSAVASALALKLLVYAPSGAIAAAATTSLPEALGGGRTGTTGSAGRDSAFVLAALLRLGRLEEADAFFWWLMQASHLTHPLSVLYGLDGGTGATQGVLPLDGYRA